MAKRIQQYQRAISNRRICGENFIFGSYCSYNLDAYKICFSLAFILPTGIVHPCGRVLVKAIYYSRLCATFDGYLALPTFLGEVSIIACPICILILMGLHSHVNHFRGLPYWAFNIMAYANFITNDDLVPSPATICLASLLGKWLVCDFCMMW